MQQVRNPHQKPPQPENGRTGRGHRTQDADEDPWEARIVLAFGEFTQASASREEDKVTMADGGGVRGYFSLLVLEYLIQEIQNQERIDGNIRNSFHPCECPPAFSTVATPFLPCHYFDFIGGTSTGALIAIMLSRFRITTSDCLGEYETMAGQIFGNPRKIYAGRKFSLLTSIRKRKYPTRDIRCAVRDVISRRREVPSIRQNAGGVPSNTEPEEVLFRTRPGTCGGLAVSAQKRGAACTTFLIRSYGNEDTGNARTSNRNPIRGGALPVCFAARAATAAPTFFRNLVLDISPDGMTYKLVDHKRLGRQERVTPGWDRSTFTDAGWVRVNNPSQLLMNELDTPGLKPRIILVSVGTASFANIPGEHFAGDIEAMTQQAVDTEDIHENMKIRQDIDPQRISYFRFNLPGGLQVQTDEWCPRGNGQDTRRTIRAAFETWRNQEAAQMRELVDCARLLVKLRRQRASVDREKWERYASG